jgi:hypothetical protein
MSSSLFFRGGFFCALRAGIKDSLPKSREKRKNWLPLGKLCVKLKIARSNEEKCGNLGAVARGDGCEEKRYGAEDAGF